MAEDCRRLRSVLGGDHRVAQHSGPGMAIDVLVELIGGIEYRDLMVETQFRQALGHPEERREDP